MKHLLLAFVLLTACDKVQDIDAPMPSTASQTAAQIPVSQTAAQPKVAQKLDSGTQEQQDMLLRAKADFLEGKWDAAQVAFEKLMVTGPISGPQVTAMIALAEIYKEKGEAAKALALYNDLLARAPDVAEVQFIGGRALAENGETSRAIAAYEKAITLDSNYLQAYVELGALYVKAGRNEEANKIFLAYEQRIYGLAKKLESRDIDPAEKLDVLEVFSFVKDDRANQAIMMALADPAPEVRERAVTLAEEFGIGEAIDVVKRLAAEDPDTRVRIAARAAAERMTGAPVEGSKPTFVESESALGKPATP